MKWLLLALFLLASGVLAADIQRIPDGLASSPSDGNSSLPDVTKTGNTTILDKMFEPVFRIFQRVKKFIEKDSPIRRFHDYLSSWKEKAPYDKFFEFSGVTIIVVLLLCCLCGPCICSALCCFFKICRCCC
uniref:Small integral membrane protein 15 n=1 Tax=Steinernema glaseri TaxID=37863 RepID=A0A1I7ZT16_9BILA